MRRFIAKDFISGFHIVGLYAYDLLHAQDEYDLLAFDHQWRHGFTRIDIVMFEEVQR